MDILPDDKDLERFFREGTDNHEFNHDPEAWRKMEDLLDRDKRKSAIVLWVGIGLLFLLFSVAMWYGYKSYDSATPDSQEVLVAQNNKIGQNNENKEAAVSTINNSNADITVAGVANVGSSSTTSQNKVTTQIIKKSAANVISNKVFQLKSETMEGSLRTLNSRDRMLDDTIEKINIVDRTENDLSATSTSTSNSESVFEVSIEGASREQLVSWNILPALSLSALNSNVELPSVEFKYDSDIEQLKIRNTGLYLGLTIGTESSATKNRSYSQADVALGFSAGYLLSNKLGFSLSSTYIQDNYIADGKDYNAPSGFFKSSAPLQARSTTDVIEIGAGLQFFSHGILGNGFNASVSSISSIMLNEQYTYNFENAVDDFQSSWTMANNTIFNSLEFSVGYQRSIGEKFAVSIEPYSKIPISGVGHGKMKLSTIGLRLRIIMKP